MLRSVGAGVVGVLVSAGVGGTLNCGGGRYNDPLVPHAPRKMVASRTIKVNCRCMERMAWRLEMENGSTG